MVKNSACHKSPLDAVEMGQRSTYCEIDTVSLMVVHIPEHRSTNFLHVVPLLTYTQCSYLIYIMHVLITFSSTSMCTHAYIIRQLYWGFCIIVLYFYSIFTSVGPSCYCLQQELSAFVDHCSFCSGSHSALFQLFHPWIKDILSLLASMLR